MDNRDVAKGLVKMAGELVGMAPPKFKEYFKKIPIGGHFKFNRKKYRKIGNNEAIDVKSIEKFSTTDNEMYETTR